LLNETHAQHKDGYTGQHFPDIKLRIHDADMNSYTEDKKKAGIHRLLFADRGYAQLIT